MSIESNEEPPNVREDIGYKPWYDPETAKRIRDILGAGQESTQETEPSETLAHDIGGMAVEHSVDVPLKRKSTIADQNRIERLHIARTRADFPKSRRGR